MMVVCAIDRPRSAIISTRSRKLSLNRKIPTHAQDDDPAVEISTFEQLLRDIQLAHCRPQPVQRGSVADRTAPFAPEPSASHPYPRGAPLVAGFGIGSGLPSQPWSPPQRPACSIFLSTLTPEGSRTRRAGWTAAHELHISLPIAQTPNPMSLIRMPVASGGCGNESLSVRDPGLIDRNSPQWQSSELS
jgi:hypothetical protein